MIGRQAIDSVMSRYCMDMLQWATMKGKAAFGSSQGLYYVERTCDVLKGTTGKTTRNKKDKKYFIVENSNDWARLLLINTHTIQWLSIKLAFTWRDQQLLSRYATIVNFKCVSSYILHSNRGLILIIISVVYYYYLLCIMCSKKVRWIL